MKNEEYLSRLDRLAKKKKDDPFINFVDELLRKVADTYDLLDPSKLPRKSPENVVGTPFYDDDMLDQFKASKIWFIQMAAKFGYTEDIPKFTEILLQYGAMPVIGDFATGWIIKNLNVSTYLRDAILEHPVYTDFEKIWRWYDYGNIDIIRKIRTPMFYGSDKYIPLSNIYGDRLELIDLLDDDIKFKEDSIINFLFKFDPETDTKETGVMKHKLVFSLYYYTFVKYPHYMVEWAKSVSSGVVYEIHPYLLSNMLYSAMNDCLIGVTSDRFVFPNINDFGDVIEEIMDYCGDEVCKIDDSLSDLFCEYLGVISDNIKGKRKLLLGE